MAKQKKNRDVLGEDHSMECENKFTLDQYLLPNPADEDVIVLSDTARAAAVLVSQTNAVALSGEAATILYASIFERYAQKDRPPNLKQILDPTVLSFDKIDSASRWLTQSAADGIFKLSDTPPTVGDRVSAHVEPGDYLADCDFGEGKIKAEYSGEVTKVRVNSTTIYWYAAEVSLKDKHSINECGSAMAVSARGAMFGTTLYPLPGGAAIGVNCSGCAVCAACAGCAACALCDFSPAAALGLVTVDGTLGVIGVAGAALTFGVLRKN